MKINKPNKTIENDTLTILNYPGSKKRLLDFINNVISKILPEGKTVLDIFCGTSSVGYSLKSKYRIISNDSEIFCYAMAKSLLGNNRFDFSKIQANFFELFNTNKNILCSTFNEVSLENSLISNCKVEALVDFYKSFTTFSQPNYQKRNVDSKFYLFTTYYSNTYFGLMQSIEIDSLRCAIEHYKNTEYYYVLLCCLYYAMKEVVFSKDGHMAQPLSLDKNSKLLLKRRQKSVLDNFTSKIIEFGDTEFVVNNFDNTCYNLTLSEVLNKGIIDDVDLVYADPPYTDMQYSRYFHLLETVTKYDYPEITQTKGKVSTGIYRSERYQSPLSQHANAKYELENLIKYCALKKKKLIFSYAYPQNTEKDKKDRYTLTIDELIDLFKTYFGNNQTFIHSVDFEHCNNRNSQSKKVYEYLIVGNPQALSKRCIKSINDTPNVVKKTIEEINNTIGTNNSAIYNSHLYWSQKPYNICDILLKNLSTTGDVVCDPFMGSGVTILESLQKDNLRKPIGIEVNDYPIFLLKTLLAKHDVLDFMMESNVVKNELAEIEEDLYATFCPYCGKKVIIDKSKFSYTSCRKKQLETVYAHCSKCKKSFTGCSYADSQNFLKYDNEKISHFENIPLIADSRIAVKENETLHDKFTNRNIKAIDSILGVIKNKKYYELYLYSLIGIIHLCKITDPKSSSQWPLWIPSHDCIEKNAIGLFAKSLEKTINALFAAKEVLYENRQEVNSFDKLDNGSYYIIKNGIQFLNESLIPDNSVDLIITDPPYMGQVIYSEYMQLYKPFLKTEIEYEKEIIVIKTKDRTKTENDYFNDMNKAFAQISRILKNGKYLCLYFHDASLKIWNKLISMIEKNGFVFEGITHVKKGKSTLKNIVSPKKSMNGDAILFFQKNSPLANFEKVFSENELINIAKKIICENSGSATTAQMYDNGILEYLIKTKMLDSYSQKYSDLTEIFTQYFNWMESGGFWTMR